MVRIVIGPVCPEAGSTSGTSYVFFFDVLDLTLDEADFSIEL
jgi:hypothetical protein